MEEIKSTLAYWKENKEDFDAKLVAREETGCCFSNQTGGEDEDAPCNN